MKETFYLLSGNINPASDTDKIHLDMLKETGKDKPVIYLFATASIGADWHQSYVENISSIFAKYNCTFKIIENIEQIENESFENVDIIYFLGGSPYKHTTLAPLKDKFKKVPIKAGTSAGAIYLGYHTFFIGKDDYVIAIPNMLDLINLHVLPHSETHKEEMVFNYLVNEINVPTLRLYGQAGLKIQKSSTGHESVEVIMGGTNGNEEKIEMVINNRFYNSQQDKILNLDSTLIN